MATRRYLCSQLVRLAVSGRVLWANLEEIWPEGAVLDCEDEIFAGGAARISSENASFEGEITHVERDESGWRIEMTFSEHNLWSPAQWMPEHALDPETLRPK
jgi:hypothetical protein